MASITRTLNRFELAFGIEDNEKFCALIWPGSEGEIPFTEKPGIQKHLDGFVLFNATQSIIVGCFGVNPELLQKLDSHHLVILKKSGDGYQQVSIHPLSESASIRLTA